MAIATAIAAAAIGSTISAGGGIIAAHQQKQAAKGARNEARRIGDQISMLEEQRKKDIPVINPYENAEDLSSMITDLSGDLSNPYANMGVATGAAEIQMEQTDIALANTLDALRETGAGGATALAQAALKSKQGVSAEIQKQEVKNQQLVAQGEQKMQQLKAVGANLAFQAQEKRDLTDLDRLQYGADLEAQRRASSFSSGVGSLSSMAPGLAKAFINPGDGGNEVNIGSGFDDSQLYNNSDQAMEAFEKADLDTMIESDIPFGGLPD